MSSRLILHATLACVSTAWIGTTAARGQLPEAVQRFDEATQLYTAGNYRDAIAAYEEIPGMGYASGALYYNAGIAYFRVDEYGQALRYWEKARRLMDDDPALLHNIEIVHARIGKPFSSVPPPFWVTWWERAVIPLGVVPFLAMGLLLYLAASALFGVRIWAGTRSHWQRRARVGSATLSLVLLVLAFGVSASDTSIAEGVVIDRSAKLSETLGGAGTLDVPEGVLVRISSHEGTHFKVKLPNGIEGYLPADAVGTI